MGGRASKPSQGDGYMFGQMVGAAPAAPRSSPSKTKGKKRSSNAAAGGGTASVVPERGGDSHRRSCAAGGGSCEGGGGNGRRSSVAGKKGRKGHVRNEGGSRRRSDDPEAASAREGRRGSAAGGSRRASTPPVGQQGDGESEHAPGALGRNGNGNCNGNGRQGSRRRTAGAGPKAGADRVKALADDPAAAAAIAVGGFGDAAVTGRDGTPAQTAAGGGRSKAAQRLQQASRKIQAGQAFMNEGKAARCGWILRRTDADKLGRMLTRADFALGAVLGTGVSGVVLLGRLRSAGGGGGGGGYGYCAVKQVRRAGLRKQKHCERVLAEKAALQTVLNVSFFVQLLGTFRDDTALYFALQYGVGGELFGRMQQLEFLPQAHALFYAAEVLTAIKFLHERELMYRDLKPENVLLDAEGHVLLCDFGFTKKPDVRGHCYSQIGTPQYLSPELLNGKGKVGYSNAVDWWAWACMLFEMLAGHTPFFRSHDDSHFEVYLRAMKGKVSWPRKMSSDVKKLLKKMLKANLSRRLCDVRALENDAVFGGISWDAVRNKQLAPPFRPTVRDVGDTHYFYANQDTMSKSERQAKAKGAERQIIDESVLDNF